MIAFALIRSLKSHPRMNATFDVIDGKPHLVEREQINLGLAIDMERKGASSSSQPSQGSKGSGMSQPRGEMPRSASAAE